MSFCETLLGARLMPATLIWFRKARKIRQSSNNNAKGYPIFEGHQICIFILLSTQEFSDYLSLSTL